MKRIQRLTGLLEAGYDKRVGATVCRKVAEMIAKPAFKHAAEDIMAQVDQMLENYGVESVRMESAWLDSFYGGLVASYSNTGDSYDLTVVHFHATGRFEVMDYAGLVERLELRYGREE